MKITIDKILEAIPEIANWIKIFISPTLIGAIIGFIVSLWLGGNTGIIVGAIIFIIGLVLGIIFAEWARKKEGTNNFMTRLMSTTSRNKKK